MADPLKSTNSYLPEFITRFLGPEGSVVTEKPVNTIPSSLAPSNPKVQVELQNIAAHPENLKKLGIDDQARITIQGDSQKQKAWSEMCRSMQKLWVQLEKGPDKKVINNSANIEKAIQFLKTQQFALLAPDLQKEFLGKVLLPGSDQIFSSMQGLPVRERLHLAIRLQTPVYARHLLSDGKPHEAIREFEKAILFNPQDKDLHLEMAHALRMASDKDNNLQVKSLFDAQAIDHLNLYLADNPLNQEALKLKSATLLHQAQNTKILADQETNPRIKQKLYLDTLQALHNSLQDSSPDLQKHHVAEILDIYRQTRSSLGSIYLDVQSTKLLIQINKQIRNFSYNHQDAEFVDKAMMEDLGNLNKLYQGLSQDQIKAPERFQAYTELLKEYLSLRSEVTNPMRRTPSILNKEELGQRIKEVQQNLVQSCAHLKYKDSQENIAGLLDRIINHNNDDVLLSLLNPTALEKYVKACDENNQKLEQAQKITDPRIKRSILLEVLNQFISLHHEKGSNKVIEQLTRSVENGSDIEKLQVYLVVNTALQGSSFKQTESLRDQGKLIADHLLANLPSENPQKVQSLILAKNYYESFPESGLLNSAKDIGRIGLIEKELRNIQKNYLQQLSIAKQDPKKLSETQYFESLSLSMQIDQALLKDDANHAIKDEDFRENFGAAALTRLGLYRESLSKFPDTDSEKRLELFGQLTSLAASFTPLSKGKDALMSGIALIPTQTLIEKDANAFFQDLLEQNPEASPLQKQIAASILQDLQFKLHQSLEEGKPDWPSNLNASSFKQFVDYAQNAHLLFSEAQTLQGPDAINRYQQAARLFLQLGLTHRISEAMDPVVKRAEQNSDLTQKVELLFSVASFYQQSNLQEKASSIFLKIEALENTSPELKEVIIFTRGMRHLNEGHLDDAKQVFKSIPNHPQAKALLENIEKGQKQHRAQLQLQILRTVLTSYYHGKPQAEQIEKSLNEISKQVLSGKSSVYEAARHHFFGFMVETGPGWTLNGYLGSSSEMSDQKFAESTYHLAGLLLKDDRTQAAGQIAQLMSEDPYVGKKAKQFIEEEIPAKAKMDNIFNAGHGLLYLTPLAPAVAFVDVSSPSTIGEEGSEAHTINAVKGSLFNAATALIPFGIARWARVGAEAAFLSRAGTLIESPLALKIGGFFVGTTTEAGAFTLSNMTIHSLMTGDTSNWSFKNFGKEFGSMMVTFVLLHGVNLGVQRGGRALEKVSWLKATPEEAAKLQEAGKLRLSSEGQQLFRGASWGLRVSSFTGSEYLNEALGLREHDNSPLWMKLLSSAVTDAQMIRAGKAIDVISGGKISRIERNTHLQYKAHEFLPALKKMGFEIDASKVLRGDRLGEPTPGELMLQNLVQSSLREGHVQTPSNETITKIQEIISEKMALELSSQEGQRELALLIHYSMRVGEGGKPLEAKELERYFLTLEVTGSKILTDSGLNLNSPLGHKAKVSLMNLALSRSLSPEKMGEYVQHSSDLKDRLHHIVNETLGAQAVKTPEGQEMMANLLIYSIREAKSPEQISEPLVKWTDTGSDTKDALRLIVSNLTGKTATSTSEGRKILGELIFKLIRGSENSQEILKLTQRLSDAEYDLSSLQLFKIADLQTPEKKLALLYWVMSKGVSRNNLHQIAEKIKAGELRFEYSEGELKLSKGEQVYELNEGDIIHNVADHELIPDAAPIKSENRKPLYRAVAPPVSKEMLALRKEAEHLAQSNTPFAKTAQDFLSGKINAQKYEKAKNDIAQRMLTEHLPAFTNVMIFLESLKKDTSLNLSEKYPPTGRTKDPSDIAPKLARRSFSDTAPLTDIVGARIIVRNNADAEAVIAKIQQRYKIREAYTKEGEIEARPMSPEEMKAQGISEKENVVWLDAKLDQDGIHRLVEGHPASGYRALHIVVEADGKPVEIQIKTEAMHQWGEIEHKLVYKNGSLPENVLEPIKQFTKDAADFLTRAEHLQPGETLGEMPKAPKVSETLPHASEIKSLLQEMTDLMQSYSLRVSASETQGIHAKPRETEHARPVYRAVAPTRKAPVMAPPENTVSHRNADLPPAPVSRRPESVRIPQARVPIDPERAAHIETRLLEETFPPGYPRPSFQHFDLSGELSSMTRRFNDMGNQGLATRIEQDLKILNSADMHSIQFDAATKRLGKILNIRNTENAFEHAPVEMMSNKVFSDFAERLKEVYPDVTVKRVETEAVVEKEGDDFDLSFFDDPAVKPSLRPEPAINQAKLNEGGRNSLSDIEIGRYSPVEIKELRERAESLEKNIQSSQESGSQSYWLRSAITFSGGAAEPLTSQAASLALHAKDKIPLLLESIRTKEKEFATTQDTQKQNQILDSLGDLYRELEQHNKHLDRWLSVNQQANERAKEIIQFAFPYHRDEFRRILRDNIQGPYKDMAPAAPQTPIQFTLEAPHWSDNSKLTAHLLENALGGRDRSDQFVLHFYVKNASDRKIMIDYITNNTETSGYKISKYGVHGLEVKSPKGKYFYIEVNLQGERKESVEDSETFQIAARTGLEPLEHLKAPERPPEDLMGLRDALSHDGQGNVTRNIRTAPASSKDLPETLRPGKLTGILAIFGFGAAMLYGTDAHAAVRDVANSAHHHSDLIIEGLKYAATIIPVFGMFGFGKEGQARVSPSLEVKPELQDTVIHIGRAYGHFADDNRVSGKHAVLYKNAAGIWCIQDGSVENGVLKPSKNGIKILTLDAHSNIIKEKILPSGGNHTLLDGQIIVLGNSSFIFRAPENLPLTDKPPYAQPQSASRVNPPPLPKPVVPVFSIDFAKYPSLVIPATSHPRDEFVVANHTYETEGQKAHHIVNDGNDPQPRVYFSIRQTSSGQWYVYDGRIGRAEKSPFGIDIILPNGQRQKIEGQAPISPGSLIVYKTQSGELAYRFDGQNTQAHQVKAESQQAKPGDRIDKIPFQQNPNSPGYWTAILGRPNTKAGSINLPNLFPIPDRVISRQHVEITATPDGKRIIKDLSHQGGMNTNSHGTWVEVEPVAGQRRWMKLKAGETYELKPGQSIALGTVIENVKLSYGNETRTYDFKEALIYTLGSDGNSLVTNSEPYMSSMPSAAARSHAEAPLVNKSDLPVSKSPSPSGKVLIQSTLFGKTSAEDLRLEQISNDINSPTWVGIAEGNPPRLVSASPESSFKPLFRIVHRNDKYYVQLSSDLSSEVFTIDGVRRSMGQQVLLEGQIYNVRIGNHRLVLSLPRSTRNSIEAPQHLDHIPILMKAPDIKVSNPRTMGAVFGGHENYGYGIFIPHDGKEIKLANSSTLVRYNANQQRYEYKLEGQNWQEWKKGEVISHASVGPLILVESNVIPQKTDRSEHGMRNIFEHTRYRLSQEGVQQHFEKIKEGGGQVSAVDLQNASLFFTKNLEDAKQSYDSGNLIRTQGGLFGGTSIIFAAVDPTTGKIYRFFNRDLGASSHKNERWYVTADSQTGKLYWIERAGKRREPVDMSGIPPNIAVVSIELERMTGRIKFAEGQEFTGLAPHAAQKMKNLEGLVIEAGSALATSALRVSTGIE